MKKTAIALLTFAAAIFAASCQKENITEQGEITSKEEGMTISAVSEGIGAGLKADLAYKYDVIWRDKDEICVKNSTTTATFTLVDGAGTTKGTFSSATSITGEVEGFYPASVANLVWPAEQQNNQVPPMYCKKNLTSTQNQTFNFNSLGSVLQLAFNSTTDNITVKSIKVSANEAMSGAFTINEGKAVISQPEGDKPGITLDLGEGVAMGTSAKYFNIAIPSGTYSALSIVLTATDGQICTINAKKPIAIEHNMVYKLTISGEFKPDVPEGALYGKFSVSNDGGTTIKQVHFSQGNLYWDGSAFKFEANQYSGTSYANNHVSHFYWSKNASVAYAEEYNDGSASGSDVFFTNETETTSKDGFTVNVGGTEQTGWRTLSTAEWTYLFNNHTKKWASVKGMKGYVIAPDGFEGDLANSYANDAELVTAGNLVFLPAAGYRDGSDVYPVGVYGYYWSSTATNWGYAYHAYFNSSGVDPAYNFPRNNGFSVRLITESK